MPIILPKEIVPISPTNDSPLIFLAGPIRGGADWQSIMAAKILQRRPQANIACPCRWDASHSLAGKFLQPFTSGPDLPRQRRWEEHYLEQAGLGHEAGCILMYLPEESPFERRPPEQGPYATDSRRELGVFSGWLTFTKRVRVVFGGSRSFHGLDTALDAIASKRARKVKFFETMNELADAAILESII